MANLQLLEGLDNISKTDGDFKAWFEENVATADGKAAYRARHLIPDVALDFENFPEFYAARRALIAERLKQELV